MFFNVDLVELILAHLYDIHTSYESEFRADAYRAPFTRYALISKAWSYPSQKWIYRCTHVHWSGHLESIQKALSDGHRGSLLRESVRVLDLHLCLDGSTLAIPLSKLPSVFALFPQIIELRLRLAAGIGAFWQTPRQKDRLLAAVKPTLSTLRALQVTIDVHDDTVSPITIQHIFEVFPKAGLSFIGIGTNGYDLASLSEELGSDEWRAIELFRGSIIHFPLDLNTTQATLPELLDMTNHDAIYPHALRFYGPWQYTDWPPLQILEHFAPNVRTIVGPNLWDYSFRKILFTQCPNLERLVNMERATAWPKSRLYEAAFVMEPRDWEQHAERFRAELEDEAFMALSENQRISRANKGWWTECSSRVDFGPTFDGAKKNQWKKVKVRNEVKHVDMGLMEAYSGVIEWRTPRDVARDYESNILGDLPSCNTLFVYTRKEKTEEGDTKVVEGGKVSSSS